MTEEMPDEIRAEIEREILGQKPSEAPPPTPVPAPVPQVSIQDIVNHINTLARQLDSTQAALFRFDVRMKVIGDQLMDVATDLKLLKDKNVV